MRNLRTPMRALPCKRDDHFLEDGLTAMPNEEMQNMIARLRTIEERRLKLAKQMAELDSERLRILGISTVTRKPPRQMLSGEAAERLIMEKFPK